MSLVFAHQPRIVSDEVTNIENPEASQAFYGKMESAPAYYHLHTEKEIDFYVSILVPDVPGIGKDISVEVKNKETGEEVLLLEAGSQEWTHYFEEFAGDWYFEGPEKEMALPAGKYEIKVFSPDNEGKYVLVVGKKEEFPLGEIVNTMISLPSLKQDFFEKPAFTAYFNILGLFLGVVLALLFAVVFLIVKYNKRLRKKMKRFKLNNS